jgi:hypothetical protein
MEDNTTDQSMVDKEAPVVVLNLDPKVGLWVFSFIS